MQDEADDATIADDLSRCQTSWRFGTHCHYVGRQGNPRRRAHGKRGQAFQVERCGSAGFETRGGAGTQVEGLRERSANLPTRWDLKREQVSV